jgi:Fe-S-cluster-containing hydrogenase component 2
MLGALQLDEEEEKVVVDAENCIGYGVCAIACPTEALKLHRIDRPDKPFDTHVDLYITVARTTKGFKLSDDEITNRNRYL